MTTSSTSSASRPRPTSNRAHEYSYSTRDSTCSRSSLAASAGTSFAEFSKERIFKPLGMRNTQWRDDYRRIVPGRSTAYSARSEEEWEINRPIEHVHGNGGILTTVADLGIWNQALTDGRLGGTEFVRMMHRQGPPERWFGDCVCRRAPGPTVRRGPFDHAHGIDGRLTSLPRQVSRPGPLVAMLCNASNVSTGGTGGRIRARLPGCGRC